MEALVAGKPKSIVLGTLRALVVPLREHWGDPEGFREAALDVLAREGGGALYDEKHSPAHLEQLYRQVVRTRAQYFRPIENTAQLDLVFKELDMAAAKSGAALQQGVLWLASRIQQQAIGLLGQQATQQQIDRVLRAVEDHRTTLLRPLRDPERLSPERVEAVLAAFAREQLGGGLGRFGLSVVAGHLLEQVRTAARRPPELDSPEEPVPENEALAPLLGVLTEPVRLAEVNDARQRYARMDDNEKTRAYHEFRRRLARVIGQVAPFAPEGFEVFCQAVEAALFPYPERLEFIRSYARSIFNTAQQSTLFDNCNTAQSVQQRYNQLARARQVNPLVLEIARAFALRGFHHGDAETKKTYLREVDVAQEFGWPDSIAALQQALGQRAR